MKSFFIKIYNSIYFKYFVFGFVGGLSFPPLYLVFLLPISLNFILKNLQNTSFKTTTLYSFGFLLSQLYWIAFSFLVEQKFVWLFPFVVCLIPLLFSFFITIPILLTKQIKIFNKFGISLVFCFLFVVFEWLKSFIFPWNFISYSLAFSDTLIQVANFLNIYVFDFIVLNFACILFVYDFKKFNKIIFYYGGVFLFILVFGIIKLYNINPVKFNKKIRIVQANIKQNLKRDRQEAYNNLKKHIDLSIGNEDIVIWSESSFPFNITSDTELSGEFEKIKSQILITGADRTNHKGSYWNSIFVFENLKVSDFYDKNKLVPFGEFMPLPFLNTLTGFGNFSKGNGLRTIYIDDDFKISPIICFEIAFSKVVNKKDLPNVIINLTNDAWFGNTSGPYQHLVAAKFRAIENRIPVIRVANTGISAYINEYGIIEKKIKLNKEGVIDLFFNITE
jgi:apolipoprotein N-acyltransferase